MNLLGITGVFRALRETRYKGDLLKTLLGTVVAFFFLSFVWDRKWLDLLCRISEILLNVCGGLLGLSIAAYAMLISMPHLCNLINVRLEGQQVSLYTNATRSVHTLPVIADFHSPRCIHCLPYG